MAHNNWWYWLATAALGIGTNLLTDIAKRLLAHGGRWRDKAKTERTRRRYRRALLYRLHPHLLTNHLLAAILLLLPLVMSALLTAIFSVTARSTERDLDTLFGVSSSILAVTIAFNAIQTYNRFVHFSRFARSVPESLRDHAAERRLVEWYRLKVPTSQPATDTPGAPSRDRGA